MCLVSILPKLQTGSMAMICLSFIGIALCHIANHPKRSPMEELGPTRSSRKVPRTILHRPVGSKDPVSPQTSAPKIQPPKKNTGNANLLSYVGQPSTYVEVSKIQILGKQTIKGHCRTHAHFSENQR